MNLLNTSKTRQLSSDEVKRIHKYPCDGVARFKVKGGDPTRDSATYSEAYDDIFTSTGCTIDDKGKKTVTVQGALRLAYLNAQYTRLAGKFLVEQLAANAKAQLTVPPINPETPPNA